MNELAALIARLRELGNLAEQVAPAVAEAFLVYLRTTATAGQSPYGQPWEPRRKRSGGGRALVHAAEHIRVAAIGSRVLVRILGPDALHHLGHARGGVERQIIPVAAIPPAFLPTLERVLTAAVSSALTGSR